MAEEVMAKKTPMDSIMGFVYKISEPLTKFGQIPFIRAVTAGMAGSIGVTLIGSIALVFFLLVADGQLTEHALLPFLSPYAGQILLIQQLSMGIMALYIAVALGAEYADIKGFSKTTGAVGALFAFILLNFNGVSVTDEGVAALTINNWGSGGIITSMIAGAVAINIIDICYKRNIKISLPDSVPPAIGDSFSAVIPYAIIALICWTVRTILDFDIATWVTTILMPVLGQADNALTYTFQQFLCALLWSAGLHGDAITGAVTNTFLPAWDLENVEALIAGVANADLPHIWTNGIGRLSMWVSSAWPLLILMWKDRKKVPQFRALSSVAFGPALFSIVEPIMFGLPIMLNSFLIIPFILSHTIGALLTYMATAVGLIGKMCVSLPWATPAPVMGLVGTGGSIVGLLWPFIMCAMGLLIFYPFWNAFVADEVKKQEAREAELEAE